MEEKNEQEKKSLRQGSLKTHRSIIKNHSEYEVYRCYREMKIFANSRVVCKSYFCLYLQESLSCHCQWGCFSAENAFCSITSTLPTVFLCKATNRSSRFDAQTHSAYVKNTGIFDNAIIRMSSSPPKHQQQWLLVTLHKVAFFTILELIVSKMLQLLNYHAVKKL